MGDTILLYSGVMREAVCAVVNGQDFDYTLFVPGYGFAFYRSSLALERANVQVRRVLASGTLSEPTRVLLFNEGQGFRTECFGCKTRSCWHAQAAKLYVESRRR